MTLISATDERGPKLVLEGGWTADDQAAMSRSRIRRLEVNRAKGFLGSDLNFLSETGELSELEVLDFTIKDISGIYFQTGVSRLELSTYDGSPIDFSEFHRLESCFLEWRDGAESIFLVETLADLYINRFHDEDFEQVGNLRLLRSLRLGGCRRLRTLSGIERLGRLEDLGIYDAWKLESLAGIEATADSLTSLRLAVCRKISDLSPVAFCRQLRKLDISDMGVINSFAPLAELTSLEELYFSGTTNLRDGDLGGIAMLPRLQRVGFQNRRHYSHRREQLDSTWARDA